MGAGNVPVIIDRDVDLKDAAEKIVAGVSFDNGIICSHEQFVFTPNESYDDTVQAFLSITGLPRPPNHTAARLEALACWLTPFLVASIRLFGLKP